MRRKPLLLVVAAAITLFACILYIQSRPDVHNSQRNAASSAEPPANPVDESRESNALTRKEDAGTLEHASTDEPSASPLDAASPAEIPASQEDEGQVAKVDKDKAKAEPVAAKDVVETVNDVLHDPAINWQDPDQRAQAVARMKAAEDRELAKAIAIALKRGMPLREELPGGQDREVAGLDPDTGELLYHETKNKNAAISTAANLVHGAPYNLDGAGLRVGVWDSGSVRDTHQEFNDGPSSRVNLGNAVAASDHGTHVGGTIAAFGTVANAKGMANQATIESYDWNSDESEMTAAGASSSGQFGTKVYLSNHSYGYSYGWQGTGSLTYSGTGSDQNAYDADFGQYSSKSRSLDALIYNTPYYLVFWAAGNENNDGPSEGATVTINGTSGITYDSSIHPPNDGDYRNGFETIGDHGVAKNLITIGAANDAVTGGSRDPSKATKVGFSSTGPTDDGRIKPDLMANGASLYSTGSGSDTSYPTKSGTSMASPNATGSATLLVELYRELFGSSAAMRASTLKALLIHTATDIGNPGPDYTHGWGLIDVKTAADVLQQQADSPSMESVIEDQLSTAAPTDTYTFTWDGTSPIRATLCWTDPAAASSSAHDDRAPDLVNDLNLKLIAPNGAEYFPFVMPFVGTWTVASMSQNATTGVNNVDNVEQILVSSPGQTGAWQVEVTYAGALTNNSQDYGLIITGASSVGALAFSPSSYSVDEDGGSVTVSVERIGGTLGAASVQYTTVDGSAVAGSDYTTKSGTFNWADGEAGSKNIVIPILNDGSPEDYEELFTVTLSNATGAEINGNSAATVTIFDDEPLMALLTPNGGEAFSGGDNHNITWASSLSGSVKIELLKNGINYTTIASSTNNDGTHSWSVPQSAPTGDDYRIRITSLAGGDESDTSNADFSIDNNVTSSVIYSANMDTNPGWNLQGQWAYGTPTGGGGAYGNPDPTSGQTGSNVIGYNLSGDYANSLSETYATTQAIDCTNYSGVQLSFYRWLNVEQSSYDQASVRVSNDGTTWTQVWGNSGTLTDNSWTQVSYDISAVADGQSTVYVRWVMGGTDSSWTYSGWNIDDVVISGLGGYDNPAGEIAFSAPSYSVAEDGGPATITVTRTGGTSGSVSVDYATSDGTAVDGSDYTAVSGTLNWSNGDGASKTINIPLANDSVKEDFIESLQITLTNTVGASLVSPNPATLNIEDDDNLAPIVDAGIDASINLSGAGGGTPVAGAYFEWDAAADTNGNNLWESTTANPFNWQFDGGSLAPVDVSDARFGAISKAYVFTDAQDASNGSWDGYGSNQPATFEFVIDIDDTDGSIFECGGSGDGLQLDVVGGVLRATCQETTPARAEYTLTATDLGRFIHVVFVADHVNDVIQLYVDGDLKDEVAWTGPDWAGTDSSSLGKQAGTMPTGGSTAAFSGKIALFRYYRDNALGATEVQDNYNAVSGMSASIVLNGSVTDPDGDPTTDTWSVISTTPSGLEGNVSFSDVNALDATATFTAEGEYTLRLTASDNANTSSDDVVITVGPSASYTISYSGNGNTGGTAPADQSKSAGADLTLATNSGNLVKNNFGYVGWNTQADGNGTSYAEAGTFTTNADTTLYAEWNGTPVANAGSDDTIQMTGSDAAWTPSDIATAAWFDAYDEATITKSGGAVSQWNDKSGNGNHATQTNATYQPVYSAADPMLGDRPSIGTGGLNAKFIDIPEVSSKRIYVITYFSDGVTDTTFPEHCSLLLNPAGGDFRIVGRSGQGPDWDYANMYYDPVGGDAGCFKNGGTVNDETALPMPSTIWKFSAPETRTQQWKMLCGSTSWGRWNGAIAEIIFTDGSEDLATQQKIEGYLAWKWGMQDKLPAAHPYSTTNSTSGPMKSVASASKTLAGSAPDPEGDSTTNIWSVVSTVPSGLEGSVSFDNANLLNATATFTAEGDYTLRLTSNDDYSSSFDEVVITVGPASTAYTDWAGGDFTNEFTLTGPNDDQDGDGWLNFVEFAFGTDPTTNESGPLSYAAGGNVTSNGMPIVEGPSGGFKAVFLRRKDHVAAGLTYEVQFTAELGAWTASAAGLSVVTGSGSSGDYEAVSVPFPASVPLQAGGSDAPKFFRVEVGID